MKRVMAIFLMWVFVAGMLVVPAVHDINLSSFHGYEEGCCHEVHEGFVASHDRTAVSVGLHQSSNLHDSLACPICQLASLSLGAPTASMAAPLFTRIIGDNSIVLLEQKFTAPRLLPFSCGPPVC